MHVGRATLSLLIAALMPGGVALAVTPGQSESFLHAVVIFGIWYFLSLPVVLVLGLLTLHFAMKMKYGPVLLPPLIGCLSGGAIAKMMYASGTPLHDMWLLVLDGLLVAVVAAFIYFRPWARM
ncbi:hypothetical protein [Xanthomonas rydalmerensis]|uniref:Uncharacterized protein n=1 Tax=Xanthomonas rydalmerensis TaxID=3046274 RepID=A0ABZ0JQD8_9XANT|nr:hypothetical protein [Xanthomonas sp. DM-2023]WOS42038.1 hypothetical protein QN243_06190 [Xanthomonas sp. DM-2023]WOS46224.1 hypothetical protein QN242_06190 [Xanthomonas sp. DM-2023]WOS50403.1 hypothetical protein QN240_06190 [Xanthomonas sp. DM-2023]WOS54583.1 hypothetical protein QN244_06190 [Xanthomonas sp. DM-2023]WOS58766.1 hypothetical protein QN245_06190 [Xanthomonas sp. DM-2023]